jgi:hypothetical protein
MEKINRGGAVFVKDYLIIPVWAGRVRQRAACVSALSKNVDGTAGGKKLFDLKARRANLDNEVHIYITCFSCCFRGRFVNFYLTDFVFYIRFTTIGRRILCP